jgi:hypothetical protein
LQVRGAHLPLLAAGLDGVNGYREAHLGGQMPLAAAPADQ